MNILLIVFLLIIVSGMKFADRNSYFDDYCSLTKTNAIKGIFALVIFFCHSMDYLHLGSNDQWVGEMSLYLKQLIVVPILFYSGFGVMESIKKKGLRYIRSIPLNKILKTLLWADIAVLCFAVLYWIMGIHLPVRHILLSLIFWEHIENNTWYFFVIVFLYIFTYVGFRLFHKNYYVAAFATTIFSVPFFYFLISSRDIFWYNTLFVYHFGIYYSLLRERIDKIIMHNDIFYTTALLLALIFWMFTRRLGSFYYFIVCGCFFMTVIVILTMKISIDNVYLQFVGKHVFAFYAFHRLPLRILTYTELGNAEKMVISVVATCLIALCFDYIAMWLDRILFSRVK